MKILQKYVLVIFNFIIVGIECACTLKANIGVGAVDALSSTSASIVNIKVGTMILIINVLCCLLQIVILRRNYKVIQLLQIPFSFLLGLIINDILYNRLASIQINFVEGILMYTVATLVCSFSIGIIMLIDEVTFPVEGLCMSISTLFNVRFDKLRTLLDVICFTTISILTVFFHVPWSIGFGTVLGMLIFGPSMGVFMKLLKPVLKKLNLLYFE